SSTHVEINAAIMKRLMEIPTVRGIKYSSYNLFDMRNIIELSPDMVVLSGFDEVCIAALSMGAQGAIGSTYNVLPASFSVIYREMKAGNLAEAQKWQFRANRVIKALVSVPLIAGLKEILTDWGIDCGIPRQPQRPLTADERARLFAAIDEAGLVQLEADARAHLDRKSVV